MQRKRSARFFYFFYRVCDTLSPGFGGTIVYMKTKATLLAQLRDGTDSVAWDVFFKRYWPLVYGWARRRGCSDHTAQDIVQDVMLKFFERRDLFQYQPERGRFRDYLAVVVRNKVAEHRRRPSGRIRPGADPAACETQESDAPGPDDSWEETFDKALLLAVLDVVRREVHPRDYLAFELTALQGIAPAEAALMTGQSRNALYKARRRVMNRLKALTCDYENEGTLPERVREALTLRPAPATERAMTTRMTARFDRARWEAT